MKVTFTQGVPANFSDLTFFLPVFRTNSNLAYKLLARILRQIFKKIQ